MVRPDYAAGRIQLRHGKNKHWTEVLTSAAYRFVKATLISGGPCGLRKKLHTMLTSALSSAY
jgi:hypothetical protein